MRVTSDRQTLILAGEPAPPRTGSLVASGAQRVTIISARVDAVVAHGIYTPALVPASSGTALSQSYSSLPALPPEIHQAYVVATPGSSSGAADAYARTRDLAQRTHLIDTYA